MFITNISISKLSHINDTYKLYHILNKLGKIYHADISYLRSITAITILKS